MSETTRTRVLGPRALLVAAVAVVCALVGAGATWGATYDSTYDPAADGYSMGNVAAAIGATNWWKAGYTGQGIDVAVIDTGVSPVPGLDGPGKVVYGPDLSIESQNGAFHNLDTYGHGTFMAGLIAGHDSTLTAPYDTAPASDYRGIAPDARIISLKVGDADGGADVSQVIAAIDWVVQHAHDPGFNIRVINLSYGTNSTQAYGVDPLAYAAEQAWKHGIVVVAAAGNDGYQKVPKGTVEPCLADPGYDPYVLAVGGVDTKGTKDMKDDRVGTYSSIGGGNCRNPDVVAPGSHLQGLRVGNSWIDANHPEGLIDSRYFRGSGTSEATAILSGAVALVLQKYPTATPDMIKKYFAGNAFLLPGATHDQQGNGEIRLAQMLTKAPPKYAQNYAASTGTGSLELARGTDHLTRNGVELTGEQDIFGRPFDASAMASSESAGTSWSDGSWNGSTWSGSTWSGSTWSGSTWSGSSWSGSTWSGSTWSTNTWEGNTWSGNTWSGASFSGDSWTGGSWSGGDWMGATWG